MNIWATEDNQSILNGICPSSEVANYYNNNLLSLFFNSLDIFDSKIFLCFKFSG